MKKQMLRLLFFSLVISVFMPVTWAQEPAGSYALLIQQSPPDAGSVSPGSGVHKMEIGQTVSLSAIPRSGYRFLYWLGDVSSTGTPDTTIQIDSPKMVVAVFTREEYEEKLPGIRLIEGADSGSGGGGGRFYNPVQAPGAVSPAGSYGQTGYGGITLPNIPDQTQDSDIPVPGDNTNDDIPVPGENGNDVPEPATILLLGFGAVAFLRKN